MTFDATGPTPDRRKRWSWSSAGVGLLLGGFLAVLLGAGLWVSRALPARAPEPVALSRDALPDRLLGEEMFDYIPPGLTREEYEADELASFRAAFDGNGLRASYGTYGSDSGRLIQLVAVNAELYLPLTTTDATSLRLGQITAGLWYPVDPTAATPCVYQPAEATSLDGRTPAAALAAVLDDPAADGDVLCVHRLADRQFGVAVTTSPVAGLGSPRQAAATTAAAVDDIMADLVP